MNLILLSGNSLRNREWIGRVEKTLEPLFEDTYVQQYEHWKTGDEIIDLDYELGGLEERARDFGEYMIFAKSVGIALTLRGVYEGKTYPVKCVFTGTPVEWSREHNFDIDKWMENYSVPSIFIQNENDPAYSFENLKKFLKEKNVQNYKLLKTDGNTHDYEDLEFLGKETAAFLA